MRAVLGSALAIASGKVLPRQIQAISIGNSQLVHWCGEETNGFSLCLFGPDCRQVAEPPCLCLRRPSLDRRVLRNVDHERAAPFSARSQRLPPGGLSLSFDDLDNLVCVGVNHYGSVVDNGVTVFNVGNFMKLDGVGQR